MSEKSKIEWTDATWTPIRARRKDTGKIGVACVKVSPACKNCYAERLNLRNLPAHGTGLPYTVEALNQVKIFLDEEMLVAPLKWKKPRKIFVCSQTDLFGEFVPDEMIDRVFAVMRLSPQHIFQVLTKRAARMSSWFAKFSNTSHCVEAVNIGRGDVRSGYWIDPLPNVWLGVTAEDQKRADERIPHLLRTPAAKRFVSVEPMLGRVNLTRIEVNPPGSGGLCYLDVLKGRGCSIGGAWDYGKLDWVIIGGESGTGARPMDVAWVRDLRDQCKTAGVACFIKQMGARPFSHSCRNDKCTHPDCGSVEWDLTDRKGGDMAEWPEDLRVREFPV